MIRMFRQIKKRLMHYSWDLAYGNYRDKILAEGLDASEYHFITNPYKGKKWFADPFIYKDTTDQLELFVEEFDYSIGKGRIGHLIVSKQRNSIEKLSIILERDTHLSFPSIYRFGNNVYVLPENSASGESLMYRYDEALDRLVDPIVILEEPITDAIIQEMEDGSFQMYATKVPVPNGKELLIYKSKSLFGPYTPVGSRMFEKEIARMAGAFIRTTTGDYIRPAQDCTNGDYGKAVHLMRGYCVISTLLPNAQMPKYAGIHTFNKMGDTFVVDFKRYDYPCLYKLKTKIK